ncbi:MAG: C-GCAxxG-C-C family protein [Alistipes sp.]|nr:C-GCAxxG-C-C family protein [Alistipes sp.]
MEVNVDKRVARARELFLSGYNCAQAVFMAYYDLTPLSEDIAATVSASFGGGMGRLREVCGAVSGMAMCMSFVVPNSKPNDLTNKKLNYAAVQDVAETFRQENGSIVCRELLGLTCQKQDPTPSKRTEEYYRKRPCVELVATAARIVGEKINSMNNLK